MSTTTAAEKPQLKDLGWQLRGEPGAYYYERPGFYFEDGRPLRSEPMPNPGAAYSAARKLQDAIDDGQIEVSEREADELAASPELEEVHHLIEAGRAEATLAEAGDAVSPACARIVARLGAVETLAGFHAVIADEELEGLSAGGDDARLTAHETVLIPQALDSAAERLGMTKAQAVETSAAPASSTGPALFETRPEPAAGSGQHLLSLTQQMLPSRIRRHPSLLMRAGGLDLEYVAELREHLRAGGTFKDAVVLFFDGSTYWVADGNHRHEAALPDDRPLDVVIHEGTLREAVRHAAGANSQHGRRRSNDDARLAVVTLLSDPEVYRLSDTQVSGIARTSQPFIGMVRAALRKTLHEIPTHADRDEGDDYEKFARHLHATTGVPEGLVRVVLGLPAGELEALTQNIMADTGLRETSDGRVVDTSKARERAAVEDAPLLRPDLLAEERELLPPEVADVPLEERSAALDSFVDRQRGAEPADGGEARDPDEAAGSEAETGTADSAGEGRPAVTVNDRRRIQPDAPAPAPQQQAQRQPEAARPKPTIEELLKGRGMKIGLVWIPGVTGKVSVSVNVGDRPEAARRALVEVEKLRPLPEALMRMIADGIEAAPAKTSAGKAAARTAASKKSPAPSKGGAKKGSKKPAARAAKAAPTKKGPAGSKTKPTSKTSKAKA